jgi:hypothetical protein
MVAVYNIAHVLLNTSSIGQIQSSSFNPGLQEMVSSGSGLVDPQFAAVLQGAPSATFSTQAVSTAVGLIGIGGSALLSGSNKLNLFLQQMDLGGLKKSGSSHIKVTLDDGIVYPTSLEVSQGGYASISYAADVCEPVGDGTAPWAIATGQSLGSPNLHHGEAYTLGEIELNGSGLPGVQSASIDFGISTIKTYGDGLVFPNFVAIGSRNPTLTFRTIDPSAILSSSIDYTGERVSSTFVLKLRQVDPQTSISLTDGLTFTLNDGIATVQSIGGQHGSEAQYEVKVTPIYDGSNAIIGVGTYGA